MNRFWVTVIEPLARALGPKVIVEIGSDRGAGTEQLLRFCEDNNAVLHVIDPAPGYDSDAWQARWGSHLVYHRTLSLEALPAIGPMDLLLVDGDHNWYTVRNELEAAYLATEQAGRPFPLVLLHDVGWPYARRDLYYNPETVPLEHRQPFAHAGIHPGKAELVEGEGHNAHHFNAVDEGTPRNGVLTAVEDFIAAHGGGFELIVLPVIFGLGILYRVADPRPAALQVQLDRLRLGDLELALLRMTEEQRIVNLMEVEEKIRALYVLRMRLAAAERSITNDQAVLADLSNRLNASRAELALARQALRAAEEGWGALPMGRLLSRLKRFVGRYPRLRRAALRVLSVTRG